MILFNTKIGNELQNRQVVKIITGINNFEISSIIKKIKAAEIGGATYIDIAANTKILEIVKSLTNLPICVSSIDPLELYNCYLAGADIVELGNFDIFYSKNIYFSSDQIINLAKETLSYINNVNICMTIPHTLSLYEQIKTGIELKHLGIKLLQTEGISTVRQNHYHDVNKIFANINKASSALSSSYAFSDCLNLPIMASSGIDSLSAPIAIYYGASAVGIGSALNNFQTIYEQAQYINEVVNSVSYQSASLRMESLKMYKVYTSLIKSIVL